MIPFVLIMLGVLVLWLGYRTRVLLREEYEERSWFTKLVLIAVLLYSLYVGVGFFVVALLEAMR